MKDHYSIIQYIRNIFSLDIRSLAVFRIAISLIILVDIAHRFSDLEAHYTDIGVLPRAMISGGFIQPLFSLFFLNGGIFLPAFLFFCIIGIALCLLIGYRTRLATFLVWVLLVSLHVRNPLVLSQGDIILQLFLFWGIFLPLGASYSLDRAMMNTENEDNSSPLVFSGGSVAYLLQIVMMYWFAALNKSAPEWWPQGTAVFFAMNMDHFATRFAHILLQFPRLMKFLTLGVLGFEFSGPFLFFSPFFFGPIRTLAVFLFIGMHLNFATFLELGIFGPICCVVLLPLLPGWFWEQLEKIILRIRGSRLAFEAYYDGECEFCRKSIALLGTFLALPHKRFSPAQETPQVLKEMQNRSSWIVYDAHGVLHEKYDAYLTLLQASPIPLFWALAWVLSNNYFRKIGNRIYEKVSGNRGFWAGMIFWLSFRAPRKLVAIDSLIALVFLGYVVAHNIDAVQQKHFLPQNMRTFMHLTQLEQYWNMFAPSPAKYDGWFILAAVNPAGERIDLLDEGKPVSFTKPELLSARYPNERWRKYFFTMQAYPNSYLPFLVQYFCREGFATKKISGDSAQIQVYYLKEQTFLGGYKEQPQVSSFGKYICRAPDGKLEKFVR